MRWSIRHQLLLPLLTLLLGVIGISTWTAIASANRAWEQIETRVRTVARTLEEFRFPLTHRVLEQMKGLSGAEYVLVETGGHATTTLPSERVPLIPKAMIAQSWESVQLGEPVTILDEKYLCSGLRLSRPPSAAERTLFILYPESLWKDALWQAVRPPLILGGFVGLAALVLALGVARHISWRIRQLVKRTRVIAAGDLRELPLTGRIDELRDLSQSINDMALQLAKQQEAMQQHERLRLLGQVSGGLAHQLRNSVTGALLSLQVHARECHGGDREALDVALRQLALMETNLKRFLDLGCTGELRRDTGSLVNLLTETIELLRPQCRHVHVDLRWQAPQAPLEVVGDLGQLGHLFMNILGNAIEAAGPGGWVEMKILEMDGQDSGTMQLTKAPSEELWRVEIRDSGPGPSGDLGDRIFEPFVTGKRDGIGLGLAVARQAAEAHGGRITWRREASCTCFQIDIPRG